MIKWFLIEDENVVGPFETQEVKSQHRDNQIAGNTMVWGRLIEGWMEVGEWVDKIDDIIGKMGIFEDNSRLWHYSLGGETFGPFTRQKLVEDLFHLKDIGRTYLWTTGMEDWAPIHEFHDIMDDVGVNQRVHKRATIQGTVLVTKTSGDVETAKLATISEGGLGFYGIPGMFPGESVSLEVISPNFKNHIRLKGEVKYISENSFIGVKFTHVHSESKSQIVEYVKKADEANSVEELEAA